MKRFASTRSEKRASQSSAGIAQCSVGSIEDDGIRYGFTTQTLIARTIRIAPTIVTTQSIATRQPCGSPRVSRSTGLRTQSPQPWWPSEVVVIHHGLPSASRLSQRPPTVAVAQSNLTVTIAENPTIVQPAPFSNGVTAVEPSTDLDVFASDKALAVVNESVTLQELVDGLNALGIAPRDLIAILQAIKATGALQAEIEVL